MAGGTYSLLVSVVSGGMLVMLLIIGHPFSCDTAPSCGLIN